MCFTLVVSDCSINQYGFCFNLAANINNQNSEVVVQNRKSPQSLKKTLTLTGDPNSFFPVLSFKNSFPTILKTLGLGLGLGLG